MTEPREIAPAAEEVVPGLWTWSISNSNIGGHTSTSQAVLTREGCLLIDPVRLDDAALAALPRPLATLLTSRCHQRAAWRYREELGAEVWLPEDASAADEQPDHTYADGQLLPGGLRAFRTPGPEWPHYSFLYEGDPGVVFCSDLRQQRRRQACTSSTPRSTRIPRPRGRAWSTCWASRSGSCASRTAIPWSTTPRPRCARCWGRTADPRAADRGATARRRRAQRTVGASVPDQPDGASRASPTRRVADHGARVGRVDDAPAPGVDGHVVVVARAAVEHEVADLEMPQRDVLAAPGLIRRSVRQAAAEAPVDVQRETGAVEPAPGRAAVDVRDAELPASDLQHQALLAGDGRSPALRAPLRPGQARRARRRLRGRGGAGAGAGVAEAWSAPAARRRPASIRAPAPSPRTCPRGARWGRTGGSGGLRGR